MKEYEVQFRHYSHCGSWGWAERIKAGDDKKVLDKAIQLVNAFNKEAKRKNTGHSYCLTGVYRVSKKKVIVTREKFSRIFPI